MGIKCGYKMILHNQHNKDENILYVIKRLFGELITIYLQTGEIGYYADVFYTILLCNRL